MNKGDRRLREIGAMVSEFDRVVIDIQQAKDAEEMAEALMLWRLAQENLRVAIDRYLDKAAAPVNRDNLTLG